MLSMGVFAELGFENAQLGCEGGVGCWLMPGCWFRDCATALRSAFLDGVLGGGFVWFLMIVDAFRWLGLCLGEKGGYGTLISRH